MVAVVVVVVVEEDEDEEDEAVDADTDCKDVEEGTIELDWKSWRGVGVPESAGVEEQLGEK